MLIIVLYSQPISEFTQIYRVCSTNPFLSLSQESHLEYNPWVKRWALEGICAKRVFHHHVYYCTSTIYFLTTIWHPIPNTILNRFKRFAVHYTIFVIPICFLFWQKQQKIFYSLLHQHKISFKCEEQYSSHTLVIWNYGLKYQLTDILLSFPILAHVKENYICNMVVVSYED